MARVLVCESWNETTHTCDAEAWIEQPDELFPALTLEQGQQIGAAILLCWATAFVVRAAMRVLRET